MKATRLDASDTSAVVDVLSEAFFDYPVMRYVLGPEPDYARRLDSLVSMFVAARALAADVMFGIHDANGLIAAVTTSNPAVAAHPDFAAVRHAVWQQLGTAAEQRYDLCVQAWQSIALPVPQLHVNMIGVRDAYRGKGLSRLLLDEVNELGAQASTAAGISLTTEQPRNVELYRHLGYQVVGEKRIADTLHTWSMFRQTPRPESP